jgi:hypothetical protein
VTVGRGLYPSFDAAVAMSPMAYLRRMRVERMGRLLVAVGLLHLAQLSPRDAPAILPRRGEPPSTFTGPSQSQAGARTRRGSRARI